MIARIKCCLIICPLFSATFCGGAGSGVVDWRHSVFEGFSPLSPFSGFAGFSPFSGFGGFSPLSLLPPFPGFEGFSPLSPFPGFSPLSLLSPLSGLVHKILAHSRKIRFPSHVFICVII
ncbi:unnamed protein product [Adineta steineri]|uniref:Secreted protein n=1 Tax=Adineta steineri TaxID=433720 RepID=A0A813ZS39_9BILA|nr:unnamed protein product [Adineta steineri]